MVANMGEGGCACSGMCLPESLSVPAALHLLEGLTWHC